MKKINHPQFFALNIALIIMCSTHAGNAPVSASNEKPSTSTKNQALDDTTKIISKAQQECKTGNWENAITLLNGALAKDPNNERFKQEISNIYLSRAELLMKKDPHSAVGLQLVRQAHYLDPKNNGATKIVTTETWGLLAPVELMFSVKIPNGTSQETIDKLTGKTYIWKVHAMGTTYQVAAVKFNDATRLVTGNPSGRQATLDGIIKGFFESIGAKEGAKVDLRKMVSEQPIGDCTTKQYTFCLRSKDGQNLLDGKSIFCINEKFAYTFTAINQHAPSSLADNFFSSISIKSVAQK